MVNNLWYEKQCFYVYKDFFLVFQRCYLFFDDFLSTMFNKQLLSNYGSVYETFLQISWNWKLAVSTSYH